MKKQKTQNTKKTACLGKQKARSGKPLMSPGIHGEKPSPLIENAFLRADARLKAFGFVAEPSA